MNAGKEGFILIQVLIMSILTSMMAMSLFESAELIAKANHNWWRNDQKVILTKQKNAKKQTRVQHLSVKHEHS